MERTAKSSGVMEEWKNAEDFFKKGANLYYNKFIKKLAYTDTALVAEAIIRQRDPTLIKKAINAIGDPDIIRKVQGAYMEDVITKASRNGRLSGDRLVELLRPTRVNRAKFKALFPRGVGINQLRRYGEALALNQRKHGGPGRIFIELVQAGQATGMAVAAYKGAPIPASGAIVLGGPYTIAKLFSNPKVARFLTTGIKVNEQGLPIKAAKAISRLSSILAEENIEHDIVKPSKPSVGAVGGFTPTYY